MQVDIGSGHFLSQSPVTSEQEASAPEPWQVGLVEEWDLPVLSALIGLDYSQ